MREAFIAQNFQGKSLDIIESANVIIGEYQAQGFSLTLRQLYYQFVARGLIENSKRSYDRLGSIINDARLAGMIDWDAIEDRTRNVENPPAWESPQQILTAVADQYQENPWLDQDYAPEVWIEKDALTGVIEPVCKRLRLPYFACRGYTSQSEQYAAGKRFADIINEGRTPIVFHLGDHDPSGIDMTRDNRERLSMFAGGEIKVIRLALTMDQIDELKPPPNPAKQTDSRFESYRIEYGDQSWELDALDPRYIDNLIETNVRKFQNRRKWKESLDAERDNKERLESVSTRWDEVGDYLDDLE